MSFELATVAYSAGIIGLYWLGRDTTHRSSRAVWIAVAWFSLACSRSVSQWLQPNSPTISTEIYLEGNSLDRAVYTGLLITALIVLASRRKHVAGLLKTNQPILWFFLYCLLSLTWSDYPGIGFKRWIKAAGDFIMILLILSDREPVSAVKRVLARTAFLLVPLSVLLIKYYPALGRAYDRWDGTPHYTGVTLNKNSLGAICLLFGIFSLWRFLTAYQNRLAQDRSRQLLAHGAVLIMIMWLFWTAHSTTSLGCFLMATGVLFACNVYPTRRPALVSLLVTTILLISAGALFAGLDFGLLNALGKSPTLTDRTQVWSLILTMPNSHLLGTGFENFWLGPRLDTIWRIYAWGPTEAHNGYIEIFLNLGFVGVILLVILLINGYRTVITGYRRNSVIGSLMLAYFVAGMVYNFTEAALFRMMAPAWMLLLLSITKLPTSALSITGQLSRSYRLSRLPADMQGTSLSRADVSYEHQRPSLYLD